MRRNLWVLILAATVLAFGYFIWPTAWTYHFGAHELLRVERWSGRVEGFDQACGWLPASLYVSRVSAQTYVNGCPMRTHATAAPTSTTAASRYVDPFADVRLSDSMYRAPRDTGADPFAGIGDVRPLPQRGPH